MRLQEYRSWPLTALLAGALVALVGNRLGGPTALAVGTTVGVIGLTCMLLDWPAPFWVGGLLIICSSGAVVAHDWFGPAASYAGLVLIVAVGITAALVGALSSKTRHHAGGATVIPTWTSKR